MSLTLEPLESRSCPAAVDAGGGFVRFDSGAALSAFGPGWAGELNVVEDAAGRVYVGPGPGGGPNLATFDAAGTRVSPDVYVGSHPESREGLIPVLVGSAAVPPVPPAPPPAPATIPAVTVGSGRLAYWLDFSLPWNAGLIDADFVRQTTARVGELLAPLDVTVTTAYPTGLRTGTFVTGRVLTTFTVAWFGPTAGGIATDSLPAHTNLYQPLEAYAGLEFGPAVEGHLLAHEFGHVVTLRHRNYPDALMNGVAYTADGTLDAAEAAQGNAAIDTFEVRVAAH